MTALHISLMVMIAMIVGVYFLRKVRHRRHQTDIDLPDFLRHPPNPGDNPGNFSETDWVEVHPLPKTIRGVGKKS